MQRIQRMGLLPCLALFMVFGSFRPIQAQTQANTPGDVSHSTDFAQFGYNFLVSGAIGGFSGMINKNETQTYWKAFYTNFLKASAGGSTIYAAKRSLPIIRRSFDHAAGYWASRALMNLGHSMVYNSSLNRDILESYYLELYGVNMRFKLKDEFRFDAKISLATVIMLSSNFYFQSHLNLSKSLKYGVYYFDMSQTQIDIADGASGFALRNMIFIDPQTQAVDGLEYEQRTIIHELIHTYQFVDYTSSRNALHPVGEQYIFTEGSVMKSISRYVNFDLPLLFAPYSFLQEYENSTVEAECIFYQEK